MPAGSSSCSAMSVSCRPKAVSLGELGMRRTPYSPFVEKETAPVLWVVLVARVILLFGRSSGSGGLAG